MKKNRFKRYFIIGLSVFLAAGVFTGGLAFGEQTNQEKLNEVNQKLNDTKEALQNSKNQEKDLASQIVELDQQINEKEASIGVLEVEISETQGKISQKQEELDEKQVQIGEQDESLNLRLRTMYKNGEVGYLEVLLGSSSFTELMTNIDMISRIYEMDEEYLHLLQAQYDQIAAVKQELEDLRENLSQQQNQLEQQKASLSSDKAQAQAMREEILGDIDEYEKMIDDLNATAEQITSLIRASSSGSSTTFVGGTFINPAPQYTRISSPYGYRIHPITGTRKLHTGLDLASAMGTKCVAAGSGTVIYAGWYGGYGNTVIIDHGGGITTLYAHNSALLVSKGQQVTQGQQIAKIGSTGNSTGPHCHFEVRVNGSHTNPTPYLGG